MTYFFPMKYMVKAFVILFIIADIGYHAFELEKRTQIQIFIFIIRQLFKHFF